MSTAIPVPPPSLRAFARARAPWRTASGRAGFDLPARRGLQLALGVIWLLDAALQYQPYMFGRSFVTQIIEPSAAGNPYALSHSVTWAAHVMLHHVTIYNAVFATIQLLLALGILYRPTLKPALAASIAWALLVWWFGEGLGGALTGATPVMGGPGGVVLYAMIGVLLWPTDRGGDVVGISPAEAGLLGPKGAKVLWLLLWGSFSWYLLLPGNRSPKALGQALTEMAPGEPGWIKSVESHLGRAVAHQGTEVSIVLAVICGLVALGVLARPSLRGAVLVAGALGLVIWVAEAFGGIFTGEGTDPNSGLLLVLLAACYWPFAARTSPATHRVARSDRSDRSDRSCDGCQARTRPLGGGDEHGEGHADDRQAMTRHGPTRPPPVTWARCPIA
jgi:hypothetical protein